MLEAPVEHVLVVPTSVFHRLGHFQGFSSDVSKYIDELLKPEHMSFRPRPEVEQDPGYKQLIPYVILRYRDTEGRSHVFQYTRGSGQGESRLHSKRSVGIGGHISADDASCADRRPYDEGMRRELEEEVHLETEYSQRCVGLINDDETDVGRVHLGVVHLFDLEEPAARPREADLLDGRFTPVEEIMRDLEGMETWSRIVLEALFGENAR